jgi:hypothetical protein
MNFGVVGLVRAYGDATPAAYSLVLNFEYTGNVTTPETL